MITEGVVIRSTGGRIITNDPRTVRNCVNVWHELPPETRRLALRKSPCRFRRAAARITLRTFFR